MYDPKSANCIYETGQLPHCVEVVNSPKQFIVPKNHAIKVCGWHGDKNATHGIDHRTKTLPFDCHTVDMGSTATVDMDE